MKSFKTEFKGSSYPQSPLAPPVQEIPATWALCEGRSLCPQEMEAVYFRHILEAMEKYLPQLQQRQKWSHMPCNFVNGDIVLIVDDTAPKQQATKDLADKLFIFFGSLLKLFGNCL